MEPITQLILLTAIAGAAIPIGGFLASIEHIWSRWLEQELSHTVLAFGGGALISAVALVLIPEGDELTATWEAQVKLKDSSFPALGSLLEFLLGH